MEWGLTFRVKLSSLPLPILPAYTISYLFSRFLLVNGLALHCLPSCNLPETYLYTV